MPKPYILKPMKPFKLDTSIPIGPQLEAQGVAVNKDANYIADVGPKKMGWNHECGCPLTIKQVYRDNKGKFTKGLTDKTETVECTSCHTKIYVGTGNE